MVEARARACPEARLVLACARRELAAGDRAALEAALDAAVDWARVLELARWHGVRPLLDRHLAPHAGGRVPRPVAAELWAEAEAAARRSLALAAEAARLQDVLDECGIPALHYKGPTLALAAYGSLRLREFGDIDVLVDRGRVLEAKAALCARGYAPVYVLPPAIEAAMLDSHAQYHLGLRSPAGLVVELHWKTDPEFPVERTAEAAWWARAGRTVVAGRGVRTFPAEELAIVLCVHGAKHHWSSLGWLVDIAELLRADACGDWGAVGARARALGCARRVGVALALARELLGAPLEGEAARLAGAPRVAPLAARFARALLAARPAEPGPWPALGLNLALHERAGMRLRHVLDTVFLPTMAEWTRWPLPRPLAFLYPGLRLARLGNKYLRAGLAALLRRGKLQT